MAIDFLDGHIRYYKSIYAIVISSIWYYKKWICYMCSCVLYYIYTHSDIIRTHSKVTWILNLCPGWESALSWMHLLRGGRWEASPATKLDTTLKDLPTRVMDMFMYGGYGYGYGYVMDMVMIPHLWLYMEVSIVMGVPPERWMFFFWNIPWKFGWSGDIHSSGTPHMIMWSFPENGVPGTIIQVMTITQYCDPWWLRDPPF